MMMLFFNLKPSFRLYCIFPLHVESDFSSLPCCRGIANSFQWTQLIRFPSCNLLSFCRWGGPLAQNWLNQQLVLQKKIVSRMLELGMTPGMLESPNGITFFCYVHAT